MLNQTGMTLSLLGHLSWDVTMQHTNSYLISAIYEAIFEHEYLICHENAVFFAYYPKRIKWGVGLWHTYCTISH